MCTAISFKTKDHYFGRTLDIEKSYGENVVIMPRNYVLDFKQANTVLKTHYAIIGIATVIDGTALYYDGTNEAGLSGAGLNFVGNAVYNEPKADDINVAQFEFLQWILARCKNVDEAQEQIRKINITKTPFKPNLPSAQLHWIFADKDKCIVAEFTKSGTNIYSNPVGVLTNNPTFESQMSLLSHYTHLTPEYSKSSVMGSPVSRGTGAVGLPGDVSSPSRFVRAAYTKLYSTCSDGEEESVNQFFHILENVSMTMGSCKTESGEEEYTLYSSCCNSEKGIYYYTTYGNHRITAVDMHKVDLGAEDLYIYPLAESEDLFWQN